MDASIVTSEAAFGGRDDLVAAAQKEGVLNVIALPSGGMYDRMISGFVAKYRIKVNSLEPNGNSDEEITAAKGTRDTPDVLELSRTVAVANTDLFAPYQVDAFDDIPAKS